MIHAILILHQETSENIVKINIKESVDPEYIENIVIGSGPSGSVTASELKKNDLDTILIEKGFSSETSISKHPGEEFLEKWNSGGLNATIGNANMQYASAECLGGGSEINSGLYHEPPERFLNDWSNDFKVKNLNKKDLIENNNYIQKFVTTEKKILEDSISSKIITSADSLNWKKEYVFKFEKSENNKSIKNSMTKTILKEYLNNGGKILLNSKVDKIVRKKNLWLLYYLHNNNRKLIKGKNIFICCGSPYTYFLLNKSNLLKKINKNYMTFHPMIKIIANYKNNLNKEFISNLQVTEFIPNFIIGHAASSKQFLKISSFKNKELYDQIEQFHNRMVIFHCTFSLGEMKSFNIPFLKEPIISYNFNKADLNIIKNGIDKLLKLIFESGASSAYPIFNKIAKIKKYDPNFTSKINKVSDIKFSSVHLLGGVPMGEDRNICQVDSFGKLLNDNFPNLYINDSSLISNKLLYNPQGTIMTIALRNIKNFLINNVK